MLMLLSFGQVQAAYACDLMGGEAAPVCCCGEQMADGCEMNGRCGGQGPIPAGVDECCTIVLEPGETEAMASAAPTQRILILDAPQPPPALVDARNFLAVLSGNFVLEKFSPISSPRALGGRTYLLTSRIRV